MKKINSAKTALYLASAALALGAGAAHADVTLYGIVDAGVVYASQSGSGKGNVTGFQEGQIAPSIYGMHGSEDLGGGLKANFDLQGGFNAGSGTFGNSNGGLFGRTAHVGLSGNFGRVNLGLQVDPALIAAIAVEPRGMAGSFSSLGPWLAMTVFGRNTGGQSPLLNGGVFDNNAISYGWAGNGLDVSVLYGLGGVAGSTSAGRVVSAGVTYAAPMNLKLSGGYTAANDSAGNKSTAVSVLGLAYEFGDFAVRGSWTNFKNYAAGGATVNNVNDYGIGVDYKTSGANKLNLAYYNLKNDQVSGDTNQKISLIDYYSLSKRTTVYAQIANVKGGSGSTVATSFDAYVPTNNGTNQSITYVGAGLQMTF